MPGISPAAKPPRQDQTYALLVGFDFTGPDVPSDLPRLRGMVNDAVAWWRLLRDMGVPGRNVTLITDQPVDAIAARLKREGLDDPGLIAGGFQQVASSEQLYDALKAFSARVVAGDDREARMTRGRLLIAWSGHGGDIDDNGAVFPAVFTPDGGHISLLELLVARLPLIGSKPGAKGPPRVVAFLGACHSADALLPNAGHDAILDSGTFGIPTLAASTRSAVAHEIQIDGVWRGAMAWAATTVLSRFTVRSDGSVSLSYGELYHRMRNLLAAVDVADLPLLIVPPGELNRNILRLAGDMAMGERKARDGTPIEVYPTSDLQPVTYVANIMDGTTCVGNLLFVPGGKALWHSSWTTAGYVPDTLTALSVSSTAFAFPSKTFTLAPTSSYDMKAARNTNDFDLGTYAPNRIVRFGEKAWSAPSSPVSTAFDIESYDATAKTWKVIAYADLSAGSVSFYAYTLTGNAIALSGTPLRFTKNSRSSVTVNHGVTESAT